MLHAERERDPDSDANISIRQYMQITRHMVVSRCNCSKRKRARLLTVAAVALVALFCVLASVSAASAIVVALTGNQKIKPDSVIGSSLHLRGSVKQGIKSGGVYSNQDSAMVQYNQDRGVFSHWAVVPDAKASAEGISSPNTSIAVVTNGANVTILTAGFYRIRAQLTVALRRRSQYFSGALLLTEAEAVQDANEKSVPLASIRTTAEVLARCHEGSLAFSESNEDSGDSEDMDRESSTRCTLEVLRPVSAFATFSVLFHVAGGNLRVLCEEGATFMDIVKLTARPPPSMTPPYLEQ